MSVKSNQYPPRIVRKSTPNISRTRPVSPNSPGRSPTSQWLSLQTALGNREMQRLLAANPGLAQLQPITTAPLIQRQPSAANPTPVSAAQVEKSLGLARFITDLNAALKTVTGVTTTLKASDFSFFKPEDFVNHSLVKGDPDYYAAKQQAESVCKATPAEMRQQCGQASSSAAAANQCVKQYRAVQNALCKSGAPNDKLIASFLSIRGLTHPSASTSLIVFDSQKSQILETVVHEGIHRLRGGHWAKRSRLGVRFYYKNNILPPISRALDEGTVHIFTGLVINELQKKQWLKGYTTSAYAKEVQYVNKLLNANGKNLDFLKKAYFTNQSDTDVELLQYWASQTPF